LSTKNTWRGAVVGGKAADEIDRGTIEGVDVLVVITHGKQREFARLPLCGYARPNAEISA
jgi:hypothetical protein